MERIIQDKNEQIGTVYDEMYFILFEFGCRLTDDHGLVEDSIHDLFEYLIIKDDFSDILNWGVYLIRALKRILSKKIKRQKKHELIDEIQYQYQFERSDEDIMIEKEVKKSVKAKVRKAIESLDERHKKVIVLRFFKELSYDEIGNLLELKPKTVREYVYNAYKQLRKTLIHYNDRYA